MQQQRQQQGRKNVATADVNRPTQAPTKPSTTNGSEGPGDSSAALRRSRSLPSEEFFNRRVRQSDARPARTTTTSRTATLDSHNVPVRMARQARATTPDGRSLSGVNAGRSASPSNQASSQQRISVLCGVASPDIAAGVGINAVKNTLALLPASPKQLDRRSVEGAAAITSVSGTAAAAAQLWSDWQQPAIISRHRNDIVVASALPRPVVRPPADWDGNMEPATRRVRDSISPGGASFGPRLRSAAIMPELLASARPRTAEPSLPRTARSSPRRGSFGSAIPRPRMG
mmetsp:Transcript_63643/g.125923  ORF Transcript_63643/g.125923 Transcript_63643/m.125923 type:complete len:287 (-) Transcript_63643:58-918(-)